MPGFYVQIKGIEDAQKLLSGIKDGSRKVIVRALNKTVGTSSGGVQSDAVKAVAGEFNLTQKDIKRDFKVKKATYTDLSAYVRSQGKPIPLGRFIRTRQTLKGVSVQVKKGRSRTIIRHAFIPKLKSGHIGVFWRTGKSRLPIEQKFSSRIPDIFSNADVMEPILKKAQERLDKNFSHEVEFLLESSK
jgi:hypothetical protein